MCFHYYISSKPGIPKFAPYYLGNEEALGATAVSVRYFLQVTTTLRSIGAQKFWGKDKAVKSTSTYLCPQSWPDLFGTKTVIALSFEYVKPRGHLDVKRQGEQSKIFG